MSEASWFDDVPVIGRMSLAGAAAKLYELGEDELAERLAFAAGRSLGKGRMPLTLLRRLFGNRTFQNTTHVFGYIPEAAARSDKPVQVVSAGNIKADRSLRNSRIKITLDALRAADYPGRGRHRVLFDFSAQNQVPGHIEHLHFNSTHRIMQGGNAAVLGYPLFVGLRVGGEGVCLKCFTVNVHNDQDEAFLGFLESDVFKAGLRLAKAAQPAIAPLSEMAFGLTRAMAKRHRNIPVHDFHLGLDFTDVVTHARLARGSYIAMQVSDEAYATWDWSHWEYSRKAGRLVDTRGRNRNVPYNYITFGVSLYEGE